MRLYLVRHGQTAWNSEGRAQGHTDIALDEDGILQADYLRRRFERLEVDQVWTSDLKRAAMTASGVAEATGAAIKLDRRLRERTFGEWEGLPYEVVAQRTHELHSDAQDALDVHAPGGESVRHVWDRLEPVAEDIFGFNGNLVVVSHGGASALLLAQLLKGSIQTARAFRFGNTAVTELMKRPEGLFLMERYNDMSHLPELARVGNLDGTRSG